MTSKKIIKTLFIYTCVFILLISFFPLNVFSATALDENSTEATIESVSARNGGGSYRIGDHDVLKITQHNGSAFLDVFYCVNASKSLSVKNNGYKYRRVAKDFTNYTDSAVQSWATHLGVTKQNHNAIVYLLNNIYLLNQESTKEEFLKRAFADYFAKEEEEGTEPRTTVEMIKQKLTDDDIDVIQQWAIWYFTNGTEIYHTTETDRDEAYNTLGSITYNNLVSIPGFSTGNDIDKIRQTYMQELYKYLVDSARRSTDTVEKEKTYPKIDTNSKATSTIEGAYYKVGPFKINSGNTTPSDLKITLSVDGGELKNCKVYVDGSPQNNVLQNGELDKNIIGKTFYVYIPTEENTITDVKLKLSYTTEAKRIISLWEKDSSETGDLQPIILILSKPGEKIEEETTGTVTNGKYDLALRKYIFSINGNSIKGRDPKPTQDSLNKLANGTEDATTAEYNHPKNPLTVKKGDKIVYEFRVYNEGEIQAKAKKIVDYLPEGLTMVESTKSTVNQKYHWENGANREVTTTCLDTEDKIIPAFNKENKNLSYKEVQLECEVTGDFDTGTILTNIAEIQEDNGEDRDSTPDSMKDKITDNYAGDSSHNNNGNLGRSDYYYKGTEDDDDFEKLVVKKDLFDLSLKKFITKINKTDINDRIPTVNVEPLKSGQNDATYTTKKDARSVETGDIVTFTIRVYNEGDISGYAEEITDYIPEGLGFLEHYNGNSGWTKVEGNSKVKLNTIRNAEKNVTLSDFSEVSNLNDVDVVLGKAKYTTNALSSSNTSNLIKAFDGRSDLKYKDVQITCVVVTEDSKELKNISAITKEKNEKKEDVNTDRKVGEDSSPNDDIDPDSYGTGKEDDDDYDVLQTQKKNFDLALQKFITAVNNDEIEDREPEVSENSDGTLKYSHPDEALRVHNGDLITYTIRVYNEGEIDGYAAEISDDIPKGLVYVKDNNTNTTYGWKMYDASGEETQDEKKAVKVKTTYLAKGSTTDNLIKAYNKSDTITESNLYYKDVKLVFKLDKSLIENEASSSERNLINIAEITKDTDETGKEIQDKDSTPGNEEPDEDDIDDEKVTYLLFDLNLKKFISKVNGKEISREPEVDITPLNNEKDDAHYTLTKDPVNVQTGDVVTFTIRVYNEGEEDGYAEQITDYIPEGLGYLEGYDLNKQCSWTVSQDNVKRKKLSEIINGKKNLKTEDFDGISSLDEVNVVLGKAKLTTKVLGSSKTENLIPAFTGTEMTYKDVQITCIVVAESDITLKNIAAITGEKDKNKNDVPTDRDSEDRDSTPADDINPDEYNEEIEDDDDYDVLKNNKNVFDLALQKFITEINSTGTKNRIPQVSRNDDGKLLYSRNEDALEVKNEDLITYTIRVYNEGKIAGYVAEITDDIPKGLVFVKENATNTQYEWKMYDKDGSETSDVNKAVKVKTSYLSKEKSDSNLIPAFDDSADITDSNPHYKDVKLVFKVDTSLVESNSNMINTAEITKNTDETGKDIHDIDSTPDNNKPDEDDIDKEQVYVGEPLEFDLNLKKFISKVNNDNTSREPEVNVEPLNDGERDADYTTSKNPILVETGDIVTFTLRVYNEGNISGYAEQITDYIPEGLGFLEGYNANNNWSSLEGANKVKLSTIKNGMNNLNVSDFDEIDDLANVDVVLGETKVTTDALSSEDEGNLIEAFEGSELKYKDVQITCIVVTEDEVTLKNISAITDASDSEKKPVTDRDSTPTDDINPDDYTTGNEDDDDYDELQTDKRKFDLALQKFITGVNSDKITNRVPEVSKDEDGNLHYNHPLEPVEVRGGDLITYTIRVYNEGETDGYAKEVSDNIPTGLVFVPENETNIKYGWKMYDKDGKETDDANQAVEVRTTYLSKENSEDNLISAFNKNAEISDSNPSHKDVELVFRLDDTLISDNSSKTLINVAEITKNTDKDGEDIPDTDSTPDNKDPDEDDIDEEKVTILDYDLALRKFIVSVNGEATEGREPRFTNESLQNLANGTVDTLDYIHKKEPIVVKKGDKIIYEFRIYNEGEVPAIVSRIVDYLPDGLTLVDKRQSNVNQRFDWEIVDGNLTSSYLSETEIPAFNKSKLEIAYGQIQIECEVTGDLAGGDVLTNVAEIITDNGKDRDSQEGSIRKQDIRDDFSGDSANDRNLGRENYYYRGLQDDDDFEKVVIDGRLFDLNLKKFISRVNNENLSREPKVDITSLNNGADDAKYEMTKTPVTVETGDIITFTLRVYNEGDISGYAEQITDYIPEGLGFLVNYNDNNSWSIFEDARSIKLSDVKNGMKNVKISDFNGIDNLENVSVVLGKTKVITNALSSENDNNLIDAFNGRELRYKDIQISCIVVAEDEITLKNIAAITAEKDENKNPVDKDRDSTPKDDINPDNYGTGNEDDDDYDIVKTEKKDFDLALQKFITGINEDTLTNRAPSVVEGNDGKLQYNHPTDAVKIHNGDLIKYTIRVYNEGQVDGYADEVGDNIPKGLVFVPDNETNVKYGWKMYDKSGNETGDVNQAVSVKTNYLSRERSQDNLIPAFNKDAGISSTNPSYKDVELIFRVDESLINKTVTTSERTLVNIAEITKTTDKDGKDIPDIDSTPDNGNPNEDDIDKEQVYVEYFDLALEKDLAKALVTVDGKTTELNVAKGETIKVDVNRKKLSKTDIKFIYNVTVRNEGEIEGYATEVTDYIPEGLSFDPADNPNWSQVSGRVITTNALAKTLLQPGQSTTISVVLTWERNEQNMGEFINVAEITEHWNPYGSPDVDSTPNNQVPTEDDYDNAPVYVSIITGLGERPYILLTGTVLLVIGVGIVLIKKYVL